MLYAYDNAMTMLFVFITPGLILPATFIITGVLIIVIVLLCGVICVMYNYRREATRKYVAMPLLLIHVAQ